MTPPTETRFLPSETDTQLLGVEIAHLVGAGDCVCLWGGLGAGKTSLARALIRAHRVLHGAEAPREVPSPTYTLINVFEGAPPIWHGDLYRLGGVDEIEELGLLDALEEALVILEWPERMGDALPVRRIDIELEVEGMGRRARISGTPAAAPAPRDRALAAMLAGLGHDPAAARPLAGDASNRRYLRLPPAQVVMDAPPDRGEDVAPFLAVTDWLRDRGFAAPEIYAADPARGFLVLEDLGDDLFARVVAANPAAETELYGAAINLLAALHTHPAPATMGEHPLQPYDAAVLLREARLALEWYAPGVGAPLGAEAHTAFDRLITETCAPVAEARDVVVLRDYHAENLLWLPAREGLARVGLLDYQDALAGHRAYDLVSLLEDARRATSPALQEAMIARYLAASGVAESPFRAAYAILGAQRNLKIIGIFARLCLRDGKDRYPALIPRVWGHLMGDLAHPALAGLRAFVECHLPEPTPERMTRLAEAAGSHR